MRLSSPSSRCRTTPSRRPCSRRKRMAIDPTSASAAEIARAVSAAETSVTAVVDATLAAIKKHNGELNAFTAMMDARARARAKSLDAERARGRRLGPLAGVPFAVKNLFDV